MRLVENWARPRIHISVVAYTNLGTQLQSLCTDNAGIPLQYICKTVRFVCTAIYYIDNVVGVFM